MSLTKQEMFNRAYRGLASQGWRTAYEGDSCEYQTSDGRRCAWGWVDMSLTETDAGTVEMLESGIAPGLDEESMSFAMRLQACHDNADDTTLLSAFDEFATRHNLTIPELP